MDLLLTALQFAAVFLIACFAVGWLFAAVDPKSQLPQSLVFFVILAFALFTAYAVVIERPVSECVEYTAQGSGRC